MYFIKKVLGLILTPFHLLTFGLLLCIFHPIQVVCYNFFGYNAHKRSVEWLNYGLVASYRLLLSSVTFSGFEKLPKDKPLIIVSNHQSSYDIPPVVIGFKHHHAKYVSKKELGRGIPSISYNLRKGGSILIDRKSRGQAIKEIIKLGRTIEKNNWSACLFPEGTRGKDGKVKKFKVGGFAGLLKAAPSAVVVPFVVDGNWKLWANGIYPMNVGVPLRYTVLDPLEREGKTPEELIEEAELRIKQELGQA